MFRSLYAYIYITLIILHRILCQAVCEMTDKNLGAFPDGVLTAVHNI